MTHTKQQLIDKLKQDILLWQGFKSHQSGDSDTIGLGEIESAFPNGAFPKGVIHEFISILPEYSAACDGFISGLLSVLMQDGAGCVWISTGRKLYPASLRNFNVEPDRIIFMDVATEKDTLWIMEEALKCDGLTAVIAELSGLTLTESRRLQLASEQSGVTGFVLRKNPAKAVNTIATARWKISPLPSHNEEDIPGIGYPRWQVELLKVRNGNPGNWILEWAADRFVVNPDRHLYDINTQRRKLG